jgi:hypothetical protein
MVSPDDILRAVAKEFKVPASAIMGRSQADDASLARHVYWYVWAMQPLPDRFPSKAGSTRARSRYDGPMAMIGRMTGRHRASIRYGVRRIEDMRDDPEFDARIARLEGAFEGA